MKHIYALLIKYVMVAVMLWVILGLLTDLDFTDILAVSAVVTVVAYLIGDLFVLSKFNNTVATISDIIIAFVIIYLFNSVTEIKEVDFIDALIAAVAIGVGEWFFHKYMARNVFPNVEDR